MKKITKYQAKDGKEFDSMEKCIDHEELVNKATAIIDQLPSLPKGMDCNFSNGKIYIQHTKENFDKVWSEFYKLAKTKLGRSFKTYSIDSYGFWRYLNDNESPLYGIGYRYLCTNKESLREYGQPYYVQHEYEVGGGQVNN